jgi:hypothetical protein
MKCIIAILLLAAMPGLQAQESKVIANADSPRTIPLSQFNRLIDSCAFVLRTTPTSKITDSGHICIIKCLNTIEFTHVQHSREQRFRGSRYQDFMKLLIRKNYLSKIEEMYAMDKWSSRSGYYFPKLRVAYNNPEDDSILKVQE